MTKIFLENLENVLIFVLILGIALIIYGLIRLNRKWHQNKYFFPLEWVENTKKINFRFRRLSPIKGDN